MFKAIANFFAQIAMYAAVSAGGAASQWNGYQPKEPEMVKVLYNQRTRKH